MYQQSAATSSGKASRDAYAAVRRPIGDARGLPNDAYISDSHWAAERDRLFARTWACVGFAGDLPKGAYAEPVRLLGMPLLILQDAGGNIRVFHNVCSHRGQRLVAEPGPVKGALRCPYHSWTYDLEGRLRGTPHIGGTGVHTFPGFDCAAHGLKPIRTEVWMDMIFVNISGDAPPFAEHVAPLTERWGRFWGDECNRYRRVGQGDGLDLSINANWKLAIENYCESYHLPWVHPGLNTYSRLEDHYNIMITDRFAGQGTRVYQLLDTAGRLPQLDAWPGSERCTAEYVAMYPNVMLGIHVDHFFAMRLDPVAPGHTGESLRVYFLDDGREDGAVDAARQLLMDSWRTVFNEDIGVVEGMQAGRWSPGFEGGLFSPVMDEANHHFHLWVAGSMSS
jgi:choline monooxygenase